MSQDSLEQIKRIEKNIRSIEIEVQSFKKTAERCNDLELSSKLQKVKENIIEVSKYIKKRID